MKDRIRKRFIISMTHTKLSKLTNKFYLAILILIVILILIIEFTSWVIKQDILLFPIILLNINRFSKFIHQQTQQWLPNEVITERVAHYLVKTQCSKIALISTLINTGCGLCVVSLWTGLSVSQTSEAIWLYTLRYDSVGFDRFFWL